MDIKLYVARDEDGRLYLYSKKPTRKNTLGEWDPMGEPFALIPEDCDTPQEIEL